MSDNVPLDMYGDDHLLSDEEEDQVHEDHGEPSHSGGQLLMGPPCTCNNCQSSLSTGKCCHSFIGVLANLKSQGIGEQAFKTPN